MSGRNDYRYPAVGHSVTAAATSRGEMSDQMIQCNYCGTGYDTSDDACPSCHYPAGDTPATRSGMIINRHIDLKQVLLVAGILTLAVIAAIVLTVTSKDEEDPFADQSAEPTGSSAPANLRPRAWATEVDATVTSQVSLPDAIVVSTGSSLTRIDADGRQAWITPLDSEAEVIAVSDDARAVVAGDLSGVGVSVYDAETGTVAWENADLSYVGVVPGGTLIRAGFGPFGLVSNDGDLIWRVDANEQVAIPDAGQPTDTIYVRTGATLAALDAETGGQFWSTATDFDTSEGSPFAMAATDSMVVLGAGGQIVAYDAITGVQLWAIPSNGIIPAIEQFGPDLVAVALDGEKETRIHDTSGEINRLTSESNAPLRIRSFVAGGSSYAADFRSMRIYDESGKGVTRYPRGDFTSASDGYFVTTDRVTTHFRLDGSSVGKADYAVPSPPGSVLSPLEGGVVVTTNSKIRGY